MTKAGYPCRRRSWEYTPSRLASSSRGLDDIPCRCPLRLYSPRLGSTLRGPLRVRVVLAYGNDCRVALDKLKAGFKIELIEVKRFKLVFHYSHVLHSYVVDSTVKNSQHQGYTRKCLCNAVPGK